MSDGLAPGTRHSTCAGVTPLLVRALTPQDSDEFAALVSQHEPEFRKTGLATLPSRPAAVPAWLARRADDKNKEALRIVYGIWTGTADRSRLSGFVGIEVVSRFSGAGIWYGLAPEHRGRGTAKTAALIAMANFHEQAEIAGAAVPSSWIAHIRRANTASTHLCAALGFERDPFIDYARQNSTRGTTTFLGYRLACDIERVRSEASARLLATSLERLVAPHSTRRSRRSLQPA